MKGEKAWPHNVVPVLYFHNGSYWLPYGGKESNKFIDTMGRRI